MWVLADSTYFLGRLLCVIFTIIIRLAVITRMIVPLLYVVIMPIFFGDFAEAHTVLTDAILFILVGLVIVSWIVTFVRALRR